MPRRQARHLTTAELLRQTRGDRSQEAFARELNVGLRTYQRWEKGNGLPGLARVFVLADQLGVEPRDLLRKVTPNEEEAA